MNFEQYLKHFEGVIKATKHEAPYDNPDYLEYTKLNFSITNRWLRSGKVLEEVANKIKALSQKQTWIVIAEPWCGDASHSFPFIKLMSDLNPHITLEIQLRDSGSEIDKYLTNGGKAVPKLIGRNESGEDIFVWGPRPVRCQEIYTNLKKENAEFNAIKLALQKWYNENKGADIQDEIAQLIS